MRPYEMIRLTWRFESPYLLRGPSLPLTRKTPCLREPDAFVTTLAGPSVLSNNDEVFSHAVLTPHRLTKTQ